MNKYFLISSLFAIFLVFSMTSSANGGITSVNNVHSDAEKHMKEAVQAVKFALDTIPPTKAHPSLLNQVQVMYYGTLTPLILLANISAPNPLKLIVQPYDPIALNSIEKAISLSNIKLTPDNDGSVIQLNLPPVTKERREELLAQSRKYANEGQTSIRNVRRDANGALRKLQISEDERRVALDMIEKLADKYRAEVDHVLEETEKNLNE